MFLEDKNLMVAALNLLFEVFHCDFEGSVALSCKTKWDGLKTALKWPSSKVSNRTKLLPNTPFRSGLTRLGLRFWKSGKSDTQVFLGMGNCPE